MRQDSNFASRPSRRLFVQSAIGLALAPNLIGRAVAQRRWQSDPFSLGVASGCPSADGFVLWTRLAPEPENYDPLAPAGMSGGAVSVNYEIALDPQMRNVVLRGDALAEPSYAYSVHAEIKGLQPDRPYWYRFISGEAASQIGFARTIPAPGTPAAGLRFAFVSCDNYELGYFSAYRHLADERPDLVVFLGDYIYEYIEMRRPTVRKHSEGLEARTLSAYRNRYAQYRGDPDLRRLHAGTTALMTWDDHEVQNDYAGSWSQTFDDPNAFLQRRAAAYQAYYEHMPLRPSLSLPQGPSMRIYDRYAFGDLAEFSMIDGRQYRSREACYAPPDHGGGHMETIATCPELVEPSRSLIGMPQEAWLFDGFSRSRARWNIVAQDQLMAQLRERDPNGDIAFWTEDWNGYPASRTRLIRRIYESRLANPVVIGGDIHSFWTNDLKLDFDDPASPTVATEFVGTSITSAGPPYEQFVKYLPDNPHIRFFESRQRGYVSVELTPAQMTTRFRAVEDVRDPATAISTLKTFVVENGKPGATAV